jgi:hypothetical protein
MTAIEINAELLMRLSQIAGNSSYMERTLEFLRSLTKETVTQTRSQNYQEMLRRLSDFQEYEEGWDDADALPLNRNVVKNFKKVLEQSTDSVLEGWTIFPAANGTLLLEYKPAEAGINIGKDDFSYYRLNSNGDVEGKNKQLFTPTAILNTMEYISHDNK